MPESGGRGAVASVEDATRRVVCGGVAGMIAKTLTAPLERIKMLSQTGEHGLKDGAKGGAKGGASGTSTRAGGQSVVSLFRNIVHHEGVIGLWAGNGANLLRIFPAKGVVFASNDFYRSFLHGLFDKDPSKAPSGTVSFFAGGLSGMTASAVTYPLDFARGRISGKLKFAPVATSSATATAGSSTTSGQHAYKGIIQTMAVTVRDEGFLALYKGITPTLLGAIPYEGIKFGTVGVLELVFPIDEEGKKPSVWRKVCFGGLGGVMAGLITYPNDTVRRLLQLQGSRGTSEVYHGYWDCVRKTYAKHGVQRFYHGVVINLIRMAPNTALQFGSYEVLKRLTEGYL